MEFRVSPALLILKLCTRETKTRALVYPANCLADPAADAHPLPGALQRGRRRGVLLRRGLQRIRGSVGRGVGECVTTLSAVELFVQ